MSNRKYKPSEQRYLQETIELPDQFKDMEADYCYDDYFDTSDDCFINMTKEEQDQEIIRRLVQNLKDLGYTDNAEQVLFEMLS
jgi:hypothetical protein